MKRLTVEQAEISPTRLGIRKHIKKDYNSSNNRVFHCSGDFRRPIHTWNHITRFIEKYLGKSWDECYSAFIKWINSERILKRTREELLRTFKRNFRNFTVTYYYRWTPFYIDNNGCIRRGESWHNQRRSVYKQYVYKFTRTDYWSEMYFVSDFGRDVYDECVKGISPKRYYELISKYKKLAWKLTRFPVGSPLTDKRDITKALYEERDMMRKAARETKQMEAEKIFSFGSYSTRREEKKRLKELTRLKAKEEEAINIIERDRLGFNEESFKTPQKFS